MSVSTCKAVTGCKLSIVTLIASCLLVPATAELVPELVKYNGVLTDMKILTMPEGSGTETLALSPDGKYLAATGWKSKSVVIWDTGKAKVIKEIPREKNRIDGWRLVFSPDGRYLAASRNVDSTTEGSNQPVIVIIETNNFEVIAEAGENCCSTRNFIFSPDGNYLLLDGPENKSVGKTYDLIDTQTWKSVKQVYNQPTPKTIEYTRDGKHIIDLYVDREDYDLIENERSARKIRKYYTSLRVWDALSLKLLKTIRRVINGTVDQYVDDLAVNPDGIHSAIPNFRMSYDSDENEKEGTMMASMDIWDLQEGQRVESFDSPMVERKVFSYTANNSYLVWIGRSLGDDRMDNILIYSPLNMDLQEHIKFPQAPFENTGAVSANGDMLAYSWVHRIYLWRIRRHLQANSQ